MSQTQNTLSKHYDLVVEYQEDKPVIRQVGVDKPKIVLSKDDGLTVPAWMVEIEDGDHLRTDEQGFDYE